MPAASVVSRLVVSSQTRAEFSNASRRREAEVCHSEEASPAGVAASILSAIWRCMQGIELKLNSATIRASLGSDESELFNFPCNQGAKSQTMSVKFDTRDESSRTHDATSADGPLFDSAWIKTATSTSSADNRSNRFNSGPASATICSRSIRAAERTSAPSFSAESNSIRRSTLSRIPCQRLARNKGCLMASRQPCLSVQRLQRRLPLSTVETKSGATGLSVRVEYQL